MILAGVRGRSHQPGELRTTQNWIGAPFEYPVLTTRLAERLLGTTRPSTISALRSLAELGLLTEAATGPRRQLRWRTQEVLEVLTDA